MEQMTSEGFSPVLALSNGLAEAVERAGRAVVAVNARPCLPSSGVHWRQGVIVTAEHTIKREEAITVTLADGRSAQATLAGRDASTDLAVLTLEGGEVPPADVGDSAELRVGHLVLALARAAEHGRGLSASLGVVSAVAGAWHTWSGGQIDQFVRLDLTLYPGFSGGALVDTQGRVVGINTSGPRNLVLAIPTATVTRVVDQLLDKGRIARGYLGLGMQPIRLPEAFKRTLNWAADGGIIVVAVAPHSPAEMAGILIGDVLVALDGKPVSDTVDVLAMLGPERVGSEVLASMIRGGMRSELMIRVGERPPRGADHGAHDR